MMRCHVQGASCLETDGSKGVVHWKGFSHGSQGEEQAGDDLGDLVCWWGHRSRSPSRLCRWCSGHSRRSHSSTGRSRLGQGDGSGKDLRYGIGSRRGQWGGMDHWAVAPGVAGDGSFLVPGQVWQEVREEQCGPSLHL